MKKALALFLVLVLVFSLAACAGKNEPTAPAGDPADSGAAGTSDKQLTFGVTVR